jgi:solute carrier family 31 (copper transporter), member 1
MLFTWSTKDLCIVFRSWHISGTGSLIFSLLAIVLLTAGYEAVREASRRYELHAKSLLEGRRGGDDLTRKLNVFILIVIIPQLFLLSVWNNG